MAPGAEGGDVTFHLAAHLGEWGTREEFERGNVEGTAQRPGGRRGGRGAPLRALRHRGRADGRRAARRTSTRRRRCARTRRRPTRRPRRGPSRWSGRQPRRLRDRRHPARASSGARATRRCSRRWSRCRDGPLRLDRRRATSPTSPTSTTSSRDWCWGPSAAVPARSTSSPTASRSSSASSSPSCSRRRASSRPTATLPGLVAEPMARRLRGRLEAAAAAGRPADHAASPPGCLTQECTIDISKARSELGYEPVVSREQGLAEMRAARLTQPPVRRTQAVPCHSAPSCGPERPSSGRSRAWRRRDEFRARSDAPHTAMPALRRQPSPVGHEPLFAANKTSSRAACSRRAPTPGARPGSSGGRSAGRRGRPLASSPQRRVLPPIASSPPAAATPGAIASSRRFAAWRVRDRAPERLGPRSLGRGLAPALFRPGPGTAGTAARRSGC